MDDSDRGIRKEELSEEEKIHTKREDIAYDGLILDEENDEEGEGFRESYRRNDYETRPKRNSGLSYLAVGLIGAVIGGAITASMAPAYFYKKVMPKMEGNPQLGQQIIIKPSDEANVATAVAKKVMPSVVGISTINIEQDLFFGQRRSEGVGSGVIVNENGYILTNAHVVGSENPKSLFIYLLDGRELEGRVIFFDPSLDLSVVKVDAANLQAAELGDSDTIDVGQTAIAIGNPLGLRFERTVTQGIVSGVNRSILVEQGEIMEDLIQTDAAINPGNSGGPLIDNKGHVVGINTVKVTGSEAMAEGMGFAIPINITKPIIAQLVERGKFTQAYLGISGIDRELAGYLKNGLEIQKGIFIRDVGARSAAEEIGIRPGDLITHIDGIEVNTMLKFKSIIFGKLPGDKVKVTYIRDNKEYSAEAVLQGRPGEFR